MSFCWIAVGTSSSSRFSRRVKQKSPKKEPKVVKAQSRAWHSVFGMSRRGHSLCRTGTWMIYQDAFLKDDFVDSSTPSSFFLHIVPTLMSITTTWSGIRTSLVIPQFNADNSVIWCCDFQLSDSECDNDENCVSAATSLAVVTQIFTESRGSNKTGRY